MSPIIKLIKAPENTGKKLFFRKIFDCFSQEKKIRFFHDKMYNYPDLFI